MVVITIRDIPPDASEISQRSTLEVQLAAVLDSLPSLRISETEIEALLKDARAARDE